MQKRLPKVIILEVLACTLAGTVSPIGTLQNIYLLDVLKISGIAFIKNSWPIAVAGYGSILIACLIEKKVEIMPVDTGKRKLPKAKTAIYIILFALSVISIFDFVKMPRLYWIVGPIVVVTILILDRNAFKIKYPILVLFLSMFILGANLQSISVISEFLQKIITKM